jgi:LysR family transcriptional regulator (chromosome initiation inhibitor)
MLDYRGIEALYTVGELQSFEAAAKKLHLCQSAVSQRIQGLEASYGEPLLIRTLPYRFTQLGKVLVGHFKRICLLEEDLRRKLGDETGKPHISIALNRDSLETWFQELIGEKELLADVMIEIVADDQERTIGYLKNGIVSACLSTCEKEILGGNVAFLGTMEYLLVATPQFAHSYFSKKNPKQCLRKAPAVKFDQHDTLHDRYLEKFFGLQSEAYPFHTVPSVRGFKQFVLSGYGYALIPKIDIREELQSKKLIPLYPEKTWKMALYWHYWAVQSQFYQQFNQTMIRHVSKKLANCGRI